MKHRPYFLSDIFVERSRSEVNESEHAEGDNSCDKQGCGHTDVDAAIQ